MDGDEIISINLSGNSLHGVRESVKLMKDLLSKLDIRRIIVVLCVLSLLSSANLAQSVDVDLAVTVEADAIVLPVNTNFVYSVRVENHGPGEAKFVNITDNLPQELVFLASDDDCTAAGSVVTCHIGNLPVGETVHLSYQIRAIEAGTSISNAVSVAGAEADPITTNNCASDAVEVVVPEPVDLSLSASVSPGQMDIGTLVDIEMVVSNNGGVPAYLSVIDLVLPTQITFESSPDCINTGAVVSCAVGTVAGGANVSVLLTARATSPGNPVTVSALVSHAAADPDTSNDGALLNIVVNEPPPDSADLQLAMIPDGSQFTVGEPIDFTFTVVNAGPSSATAVSIINDPPDELSFVTSSDCVLNGDLVVCDIGHLEVDEVYIGTVTLTTTSAANAITNVAHVVGNEVDPNPVNNVGSVTLSSVDPNLATATDSVVVVTATITNTPIATATPFVISPTPGPTQTPFQVIVTQPVFITEAASDPNGNASSSSTSNGGADGIGDDPLSDGVAPSDIYGWTRHESIALIQVLGQWFLRTMQNASDGAYHEARDAGALLRFPFEGDGFRIGYRSEVNGASFQILLDGAAVGLYPTSVLQIDPELDPIRQTFVTQPYWVTPGYHVVDLVCLAAGDGSPGCNIDYIEIFTGPPIPLAPTPVAVPSEAVVVEHVELVSAPPTIVPSRTPAPDAILTIDVLVSVDLNSNDQADANEGVADITVRAVDVSDNTLLSTSITDESGFVRIRVASDGDIVLLIPVLGESFYVRNRGHNVDETWNLVLDPATLPGLIP